ncbi:MAG: DNA polymerase III subunit delta [Rickettsiales bacterium]|jgi:DNA polymerase-3 subunit delta|nr:DNA polymerase III subunit delta [Rickettsiales bacterium]
MKIENRNINSTVKSLPNSDFSAALLYGDVDSSMGLRCREIVNIFLEKGYETSTIAPEDIKGDEGALAERFVAISMFSANTLFLLKLLDRGNMFTKHLENLFDNTNLVNNRNFLLITSDSLETSSSLRKYSEKSKHIACIPCYSETSADLAVFIRKKLQEYNLTANSNVISYISSIGASSTTLENEIQKLYLYKGGEDRVVSMDDVQNCLVDSTASSLDDLLNNFCSLDRKATLESMNRILGGGAEPIAVLRAMIRHFLMLQRMCRMLEDGGNLENIFTVERIFWKSQDSMRRYIGKWTAEGIGLLLEKMVGIEKSVKFSSFDATLELDNFLLQYLI